jgi:UDP-N-acetylmuramoylalanine--D-glutamate ligase
LIDSVTRKSNIEDLSRAAEGMRLRGKKVLVVGLARSGVAAAALLTRKGAQVTVTDVKPESDLTGFSDLLDSTVGLKLGGHDTEDFLASDLVVLSPGVPTSLPEIQQAISNGIPVISEVELAYRFLTGTFIGVTGSNGKTTTTTLLGQILKSAGLTSIVAGNIGDPMSGFVTDEQSGPEDTVYVIELSSFQLETISRFRCDVSVILNITPDHLDRYSGFSAYAAAKERILLNQTSNDFAVINRDDPTSWKLSDSVNAHLFPFSKGTRLEEGAFIEGGKIIIRREGGVEEVMPVSSVSLKGEHNLENVLAAVAVASLLGVSREPMSRAISSFSGVEHRLELVRRFRGIEYYNDSKATNLDSAIKALQAFETNLIVIMGGLDKGADFEQLRSLVSQRVKRLILIGTAAEKISSALGGAVPISRAENLNEAVHLAAACAEINDVVLLAPACASFDMFENYEHRGKVFKNSVMALN